MGVYTFSSKPTTPGERTPDLLIRFQAVSRTQPCVRYRFMSVHSRTKLHQVRRYITKYFKNIYDGGFIFLCKTKEILKSDESQLTVFDILPKIPQVANQESPRECFQYPDVQYKKIWYNYDGKRYSITCACVIFLFERSKVSHWPSEVLREELGASAIEGFAHIPTDIVSWSGKLVECRGTPLHIHAALGQKEELSTAIHQLPEGTTAKSLTDPRGATPLHYAAANGKLDVCEILVAGMGSDMIYHTDNGKCSPLHRALYRRRAATITYLIQLNADIDTPDNNGNNCLDLLYKQNPKDIEFIVSKLETDCVDNRVQFCLLYLSMKNRKFSHVRQLAKSMASCPDTQNIGTTLLHMSAALQLTKVTTTLVKKGFNRAERDVVEFLPFHVACKVGATDQIKMLMYPEMTDSDLNKGIQLCIRYGHISGCEEINAFRSNIAMEESTVCMVMKTFQSILRKLNHKTQKHFETISRMILPLLTSIPNVLNTCVFDCALYGASETLILLKSLGADFKVCDFSNRSPLHEAAQSHKLRCTQVLLKGGANPNAIDWRGSTALHYACGTGNVDIVECLMEDKNMKPNIRDVNGRTPLLVAAYFRRNEAVCYLLRRCDRLVDMTVVDKYGYGLLHFAVHLKESTVELIVETMSMKPKALVVEDGNKSKLKIPASSWIEKITFTDFRAHKAEEEITRKFSMARDESSTLWISREKAASTARKLYKSPEFVYEECSGCGHVFKQSSKHTCISPSENRNKIIKLRAFKLHDRFNWKAETSPFFLAVKTGKVSVMRKIRKLDPQASTYRDNFGRNCLYLAIDMQSLKLVKAVIALIPDIEKSEAVHRLVAQTKGSKRESTPLSLLTYLLSIGCNLNGPKSTADVVINLAIEKNNIDIIKFLVENVNIISDKTMALAINSGSANIVESVLKKWRKNKECTLNEFNLLSIACSSRHLSLAVVQQLLPLYNKAKEHVQSTKEETEGHEYLEKLCKSLNISLVKRRSLLGKLLCENHPALKSKPRVPIDVFQKIGSALLDNDFHLGLDHHYNVHVVCECLMDCVEMKCYDLAASIIQKASDVLWNCAFSDKQCSFHTHFQKKVYSYEVHQSTNISYLKHLIMTATKKDVSENVLYLLLKQGMKYFKSDVGMETSVDIDILQQESQTIAEGIADNMIKLILTILELIAREQTHRFNVLRIWKFFPSSLAYVHLLSRRIDTIPFIKTKEECFINNCYPMFRIKGILPEGTTVLHVAAGFQDTSILKMIVKAPDSVDCNVENADGVSPLDMAVACGYWQNYKILMDHSGDVNRKLLEQCCMKGSVNVREILRKTNPLYDDGNHNKSRLRIVQDVWSRLEIRHDGQLKDVNLAMLTECARNKLWEIDDYFLEKAYQLVINQFNQDSDYIRLLCIHCPTNLMMKHLNNIEKHMKSFTHTAIGEVILNVTIRDENIIHGRMITKTMVSLAAESSYDTIMSCKDKHGKTALHHAAKNGNLVVLQYVASKLKTNQVGESPTLDILDAAKASPLWYALSNQHWKCAQCLLIAGCDPTCKRVIPDFDVKRRFTLLPRKTETSLNNIPGNCLVDWNINFGIRVFPGKVNKSANMARRMGKSKGSIFELRQQNVSKRTNTKQSIIQTRVVVVKIERTPNYKKTLQLVTLAHIAKRNGVGLIHMAYSFRKHDLVSQIVELDKTYVHAEDKFGVTPLVCALVNGNIEAVQKEARKDKKILQVLVWRFMSSAKHQDQLMYTLTQLLRYFGRRCAARSEEHIFSHLIAHFVGKNDDSNHFLENALTWGLTSFTAFTALLSDVKQILNKFYEDTVVREFITLFHYLPFGDYTQEYNRYSCMTDPPLDQIHQAVSEMIRQHISSVGVGNIPREIWTLLLFSGESWVMKTLLDELEETNDAMLKNPFLLDFTITDLIPFSVQSEDICSRYTLEQENIEHVRRAIKMEATLTLQSDIVDIAKDRHLWKYLELIGQHILIESGELNPLWQTIMAKAAETGQISFIKCIVSSLEVSKMTNEQKYCFIAFICIASVNGHHEIVRYLERNRIPLVGEMDQPSVKDLMGQFYVSGWNILEYAVKGNSVDTVNFLLKCLKDDKSIRTYVNGRGLLQLSAEKGNVDIYKSVCHFMDKVIGLAVTREELDEAYRLSLIKGRETFCIHLVEQMHTSLVIYTDDKSSSLHYAASHGMCSLTERIVKSRPEIIDQTNTQGYTALDYANVFGKIEVSQLLVEYKANVSSLSIGKLACSGWFHQHLLSNENNQTHEKDYTLRTGNTKNRPWLDLASALESGNDLLAASAIKCSGYLIKANLDNDFFTTIKIFFAAARTGAIQSLQLLCELITDNEDLLAKVLAYEDKHLNLVASAVQYRHEECIKVLLELKGNNNWKKNRTGENILHIAVKTEQLHIVQLVNEKTKGTLKTEGDRQNLTPILYAASLGLQQILSYLISDIVLLSEEHQHHDKTNTTFEDSCLECVLDLCIGWSKLYQSRDSYQVDERQTRPINVINSSRGFQAVDKRTDVFGLPGPSRYSTDRQKIYDGYPRKDHIPRNMMRQFPPGCQAWKSLLTCMGYKDELDQLQEFVLKISSQQNNTLHQRMKKAMIWKDYTDTIIRLSETDTDTDDLLLTAAACGNTEYLNHYLKSNTIDYDNASVYEVAFAFGHKSTAISLHQNSDMPNLQNAYPVFHEIAETLPQRIKWIIGLETPGDDGWDNSVKTTPLDNSLSKADLWVLADFSQDIVNMISKHVDQNLLIPQTICGRKYTADIDSFKKNVFCSNLHSVTLRAYLSSSHIYGRQLQILTNNGSKKLKTVQAVKVTCEPSGPGNIPKVHIDHSGNYLESVAFTQTPTSAAITVDNSVSQHLEEANVRIHITEDILPLIVPLVEKIFQRHVKLRIDWMSLESRRRTGNYDLLLKLLTGDLSGCRSSHLAGLEDVLEQCIETREDLMEMFNRATVDIALQSLSHIREVVVVYVDTLQTPATPRKGKSASLSDTLTWEFTYEKSTLKYNRDNFPLLTALQRYQHLAGAIYNSLYRIADVDANADPKNRRENKYRYIKPQEQLTLDIDLKSFGIKNGTMINEQLVQGISREVDAIATECEGMMRLKLKASQVILRNSASVQGTGITLQDTTVTISVCTHLSSQKCFTVERGHIGHKLEDLEDQQVFRSWNSDLLDAVKEKSEDVSRKIKRQYGINVQIMFDDKRIIAYAFQRYRREMVHPHILVPIMMMKCIDNISVAMTDLISDIYYSLNGEYCIAVRHQKGIPDGLWIPNINTSSTDVANKAVIGIKYIGHDDPCYNQVNFGLPVYTLMNKLSSKQVCWRHSDFEMIEGKHSWKGLVSMKQRLYKISDQSAFQRVLATLQENISFNSDTLLTVELLGISILKERLSPDFFQTIQSTRLPIPTTVVRSEVQSELQNLFLMLKLNPPDIEIDFQSFITSVHASTDVREASDNIVRIVYRFSSHLKTALLNLMFNYKLLSMPSSLCPYSTVLQRRMLEVVGNIEKITFKYNDESQLTEVKNTYKQKNPEMIRIHNNIEVVFYKASIDDCDIEKQLKNIILSLLTNKMKDDILETIVIGLNIQRKQLSVTTKYTGTLELEEALLLKDILQNEKNRIELSNFHVVKVEGTQATFRMSGKSSLQFIVAVDEKLQIDNKLFKRVCKPQIKPEMPFFESDFHFLHYGENSIRLAVQMASLDEDDFLESSLYSIDIRGAKSAANLHPTKCEVVRDNVISLHFVIPQDMDTLCNISLFYKSNPVGHPVKSVLYQSAESRDSIPRESAVQIEKDGMVNILVSHDCSNTNPIDFEIVPYRLVRKNKMVEPLVVSRKSGMSGHTHNYKFVASYVLSHIHTHTNSRMPKAWETQSPIRISHVSSGIDKYSLHVYDSKREIKIKAFCIQCKQCVKISTPFPEIFPHFELCINNQDEDMHDYND